MHQVILTLHLSSAVKHDEYNVNFSHSLSNYSIEALIIFKVLDVWRGVHTKNIR